MNHIKKAPVPEKFIQWKEGRQGNLPSWDGARHEKKYLKPALLAEQFWICCYCESEIENETEAHIEHFRPRNLFPELMYEYGNLLCSCSPESTGNFEDCHCGQKKGQQFDEKRLLSPLDENCETYFEFLWDGKMTASSVNPAAAEYTMEVLGLNCPELQAHRKAFLDGFVDETLSIEEMQTLARLFLEFRENGRRKPYPSMIRYLFAKDEGVEKP